MRKTIINKSLLLMEMMDNSPYDFIKHHEEGDLQTLEKFKHRTFQPADTLYFIHFLKEFYAEHQSLEWAFRDENDEFTGVKNGFIGFRQRFFNSEYALDRTKKHVPTPAKNSACKRLNMFFRWMVRSNENNVDFGIWQEFSPRQLYIPLDVHVHRIALQLGLLTRTKADWTSVELLTDELRKMDADDPVKYDFALFTMGMEQKNKPFDQ
ncbi:TIGR02757 family protein [Membranihabitans marinus]